MVGPSGHGDSSDERGGLPDLTKRIVTLGLGAYFLTEDTLRRYVKDAKLPRDVAKSITQNASKGKDELYGFIARELSSFLEKMDLQEEVDKFVKTHKIRINAEIEFVGLDEAKGKVDDSAETLVDDASSGEGAPVEWNVSFKGAPAAGESPGPDDSEPS